MDEKQLGRQAIGRAAWPTYAALLLTSGLLAPIWVTLLMRDINRLKQEQAFRLWFFAIAFATGLAIYFALIFFPPLPGTSVRGLSSIRLSGIIIVGLCIECVLVGSTVAIARQIAIASGERFSFPRALWIILLALFLFLALPILQLKINAVARSRE